MFFDIPNKDGLWVFNSPMINNNQAWQTWVKPTQYNNFIIYVCGGGGAGGQGSFGASGARPGGGGGAGGQLVTINAPSFLLPEIIYINIGLGGINGAGGATYINYFPNTNTANNIALASGGGAGALITPGNTLTSNINQTIFSSSTTAGSSGATGGSSSAGSNFSITSSCVYGGAGGGGIDASNVGYAGGSILASNIHPQLDGGAVGGGNGVSGYFIKKPFTSLGGSGGGANPSGLGGRGGDGFMGSGGGGAGGGVTVAPRSKGGDGFVIIIGY